VIFIFEFLLESFCGNDGKVYLEFKGAVMRCRSNLVFPQNPFLCSHPSWASIIFFLILSQILLGFPKPYFYASLVALQIKLNMFRSKFSVVIILDPRLGWREQLIYFVSSNRISWIWWIEMMKTFQVQTHFCAWPSMLFKSNWICFDASSLLW
jgi:hypothetical protein